MLRSAIKHHLPNAKLIAVLRNPVERAFSEYLFYRLQKRENFSNFFQALEAEKQRIKNNWNMGRYTDRGFYFAQLKRYFDLFDHQQIKIHLHEDLNHETAKIMKETFRFLEVDEGFSVPLSPLKYNTSGVPKNRALDALIQFTFFKSHPIKDFIRPVFAC